MSLDQGTDTGLLLKLPITKSNPTGFRVANTNLTNTWWNSPNLNIATITNSFSEPMYVDATIFLPSLYKFFADARIQVLAYYQVLRNGAAVDGWRLIDYQFVDNRGNTTSTTEVPLQSMGSASNFRNVVAQPGDVITVQQRIRARRAINGPGAERIYIYNGQSKIELKPLIDIVSEA